MTRSPSLTRSHFVPAPAMPLPSEMTTHLSRTDRHASHTTRKLRSVNGFSRTTSPLGAKQREQSCTSARRRSSLVRPREETDGTAVARRVRSKTGMCRDVPASLASHEAQEERNSRVCIDVCGAGKRDHSGPLGRLAMSGRGGQGVTRRVALGRASHSLSLTRRPPHE
jgi:hypothetical protein